MLRCNLTKSDESTFFILNVDWVYVRNWVLRYINENAKHSAESILKLYIHFPLSFPVTSGRMYHVVHLLFFCFDLPERKRSVELCKRENNIFKACLQD